MRYWIDCEFEEGVRTLDLISIGIISEDDRRYYAESLEYDRTRADPWIEKNVIPKLTGPIKTGNHIADDLREFLGTYPEIWGYYGAYDFVCLYMLFNRFLNLPKTYPRFIKEINQLTKVVVPTKYAWREDEHNALSDAIYHRDIWRASSGENL